MPCKILYAFYRHPLAYLTYKLYRCEKEYLPAHPIANKSKIRKKTDHSRWINRVYEYGWSGWRAWDQMFIKLPAASIRWTTYRIRTWRLEKLKLTGIKFGTWILTWTRAGRQQTQQSWMLAIKPNDCTSTKMTVEKVASGSSNLKLRPHHFVVYNVTVGV